VSPPIDGTLTLHSSWRGILGSAVGASIVLAAGVVSVAGVGPKPVPLLVLAVGVLLVGGFVFDVPVSTRFDERGIVRRALGRHHRIGWERVDHLTRTRPRLRLSVTHMGLGGLVAVVGRRRYLLSDRVESEPEFDGLIRSVERWAPGCGLAGLLRPPGDAPPTWLYRRRRWRPDASVDR
jgi:hypothetical protein